MVKAMCSTAAASALSSVSSVDSTRNHDCDMSIKNNRKSRLQLAAVAWSSDGQDFGTAQQGLFAGLHLAFAIPPALRRRPLSCGVRRHTHVAAVPEHPHNKVRPLPRLQLRRVVSLHAPVQQGNPGFLREHRRCGGLREGDLAAGEVASQTQVEGEGTCVAVLRKRHVVADLVSDGEGVVVGDVGGRDVFRVEQLRQRREVPPDYTGDAVCHPDVLEDHAVAVHAVRPADGDARLCKVPQFLLKIAVEGVREQLHSVDVVRRRLRHHVPQDHELLVAFAALRCPRGRPRFLHPRVDVALYAVLRV
eukprot:Rhum_TRINITY_DN17011_c0_g1::Rhum_TRINITY_DN17011_c0_g1_i1::g.165047::m.165047